MLVHVVLVKLQLAHFVTNPPTYPLSLYAQTQEVVDRHASWYLSSLVVEGPLSLVTGSYQCRAKNENGSSSSMELLVSGGSRVCQLCTCIPLMAHTWLVY